MPFRAELPPIEPPEAEALTLAPYRESDWPALAELLSDRQLLRSLYPQSQALAAQARVVADWRRAPPGPQDLQFVVRLDEQRVIGCVRLERLQLSYFLGRAFCGRGLGSRMLGLVAAELRAMLPGESIQAQVARDNIASCRVLQQNGFAFSGIAAGPSRLHCWQTFSYRVQARPAASHPAEELEQSAVDRR